jgi:hypothetical protein
MSVINNNIQNAVNCVSCCAFENIEREDTTNHEVYIGNSQTTCACYEPSKVFNDIGNFIVTECDRIHVWMCSLSLRNSRTLDARSCPAGCCVWADMCIALPDNLSITAYGGTRGALYAVDLTLCGYECRRPDFYVPVSFINIGKSYCDCSCPTGVSTMFAQTGCFSCYKAGQHNVAIMACPTHISFSAESCALMYLEASVMRIY